MIDTGFANRCNNDHGISPDGTLLAISDQSQGGKSLMYVLPIGRRRRRAESRPSVRRYWHGWSPDGASWLFAASAMANLMFIPFPSPAGKRSA